MTHVTRKKQEEGYRQLNFTSRKTSTDYNSSESKLPGSHLVDNNLVNITRDAHSAEARSATRGTGCLSIDSLLPLDSLCIAHFTTMNLKKKKHREWTGLLALSGSQTQTRDTEKHACDRRTEEDNNRAYDISIHLEIDNSREYRISIRHEVLEIDSIHPKFWL